MCYQMTSFISAGPLGTEIGAPIGHLEKLCPLLKFIYISYIYSEEISDGI